MTRVEFEKLVDIAISQDVEPISSNSIEKIFIDNENFFPKNLYKIIETYDVCYGENKNDKIKQYAKLAYIINDLSRKYYNENKSDNDELFIKLIHIALNKDYSRTIAQYNLNRHNSILYFKKLGYDIKFEDGNFIYPDKFNDNIINLIEQKIQSIGSINCLQFILAELSTCYNKELQHYMLRRDQRPEFEPSIEFPYNYFLRLIIKNIKFEKKK